MSKKPPKKTAATSGDVVAGPKPKIAAPDQEERARTRSLLEVVDQIKEARKAPIALPAGWVRPTAFRRTDREEIEFLRRERDHFLHESVRLLQFARWALGQLDTLQSNAKRSRGSRSPVLEDGQTLDDYLKACIAAAEQQNNGEPMSAKDLWRHVFALLEQLGLGPTEVPAVDGDVRKSAYVWNGGQLSFGSFSTKLSAWRRASKK